MAMSRDRGTARQAVDQGYGLVCDEAGLIIPDLIMANANQEHGIIALRPGSNGSLPDLLLGGRLSILQTTPAPRPPQFDAHNVIPSDPAAPLMKWHRIGGW